MNFSIEIRNRVTGEAKTFASKQEVANFLAGKDLNDWEGFRHLGELPTPELQDAVVAEAHQEPAAPRAMRAKFAVEAVENVSDTQQNVFFRGVGASHYPDDGFDENNSYAKWTPMAEARFAIMNPALRDAFAVGDEFYADFTLAKKAAQKAASDAVLTGTGATLTHVDPQGAVSVQAVDVHAAAPEGPAPESKA